MRALWRPVLAGAMLALIYASASAQSSREYGHLSTVMVENMLRLECSLSIELRDDHAAPQLALTLSRLRESYQGFPRYSERWCQSRGYAIIRVNPKAREAYQ